MDRLAALPRYQFSPLIELQNASAHTSASSSSSGPLSSNFLKESNCTKLSALKLASQWKKTQAGATSEGFSSPKTGSVGTQRFKDGALPGTYWDDRPNLGEDVFVSFNTGSKNVTVNCKTGDNFLKVAESCGAMRPTRDFCFEGSCYHCEMEVEGGAHEVGQHADPDDSDLIRSCICPVPGGRQTVLVNVWGDEE